jgi:hypothetical protein
VNAKGFLQTQIIHVNFCSLLSFFLMSWELLVVKVEQKAAVVRMAVGEGDVCCELLWGEDGGAGMMG